MRPSLLNYLKENMTKICIISPSYPYMHCGIGDYTAQLINSLIDSDLQIGVITSSHEKIRQFVKSQANSKILVFPVIKRWDFLGIFALYRKIRDFRPDILHIQYQWWLYHRKLMITLLPLFLKILRKKLFIITTFHDLMGPYLFPKAGPLRKLPIMMLALFSDKIITTAKKDTENLIRLIPKITGRISHVPSGPGIFFDKSMTVDVEKIRKEFKDDENQVTISNFGYMLPYKGIEDLLQATKILIDKKYNIKLLAIGGLNLDMPINNSYFSKIQKKVNDLKIAPHVKWVGHCTPKEVSSYLMASDICALPYTDGVSDRRTSFTCVLSHGLPVITTRHDNTSDKLIDHQNVLLVRPNDPCQLAQAIEELINSPQLRDKLGKAARKLYEEEYSWGRISDDTLKIYNSKNNLKNNIFLDTIKN